MWDLTSTTLAMIGVMTESLSLLKMSVQSM